MVGVKGAYDLLEITYRTYLVPKSGITPSAFRDVGIRPKVAREKEGEKRKEKGDWGTCSDRS
jgi:hypothetical protein